MDELSRKIDDLEQRLGQRQRSAIAHVVGLEHCIARRLTSPLALLIAAGIGYSVEHFGLLSKAKGLFENAEVGDAGMTRHAGWADALGIAESMFVMLMRGVDKRSSAANME